MKPIIVISALLLCGCARFSTKQQDLNYGTNGIPQRQITTKATAFTFFSSSSELANFKANQTDKTQSATVGNLSQESSGTNVVDALTGVLQIINAVKRP